MNEYRDWRLAFADGIVTVTLNRPAAKNCFAPTTFAELREISGRLAADRSVRAVIVQGEGEHFSIGMDTGIIQAMIREPKETFRAHLRDLQLCLDAFEALEKPTVAKIRGFCIGAGLVLALCCDFRIASRRTIFGLPEVKLGVAVVMGTQRLVRVAGVAAAKEIILLGERFNAAEAEAYGLLHRVVAPEELDAAAKMFAARFRELPPRTIGIAKRIIDRGYGLSVRDSQEIEIEAQAELLGSHDLDEALASYLEKRAPAFTGE